MKEFNLSGTKIKVFYLEKPDPKKLETIYDSINNLAMHLNINNTKKNKYFYLKDEAIKDKENLD